ncbi:MAG: DNA repair protein RadC [Prosthecobacter sp.]|jgi:DNA repair protein RadC|uniref:RadC family protein n=1 Tax=Prosthecobacter sp. TaxID=1965333 RepID=UPI0019E41BB2|nr:DNA repair protein RadC [Prosthecobacter sp.]MBE2287532.1 DNA repair protein RadC [Prosthecobacter sp.]
MSRIHDIPENDRPRERLLRLGPQALSDAELLALFINTGTKGENALQIGQRILRDHKSLRDLSRLEPAVLSKIKALGPAKTAKLAAAFELGRRAAQQPSHAEIILDSPPRIYEFIGPELQALGHESVRIILLNTRLAVIRAEEVFKGSLNECISHPRDLLRKALVHNAHAFVLIHNHPSGDPTPSDADRRITRRLREGSEATGVLLQDHIIIGTPAESRALPYFSFREHGLL